jgi:hypothetical protein
MYLYLTVFCSYYMSVDSKSTSRSATSINTVKASLYVWGIKTKNQLDIGECVANVLNTICAICDNFEKKNHTVRVRNSYSRSSNTATITIACFIIIGHSWHSPHSSTHSYHYQWLLPAILSSISLKCMQVVYNSFPVYVGWYWILIVDLYINVGHNNKYRNVYIYIYIVYEEAVIGMIDPNLHLFQYVLWEFRARFTRVFSGTQQTRKTRVTCISYVSLWLYQVNRPVWRYGCIVSP